MEDDDLPRLVTRIEIVKEPIPQNRRIGGEGEGRRLLESCWTGQLVIEQMGIGIQEDDMRVAIVERIVALVIDLALRTLSGVHGCAGA